MNSPIMRFASSTPAIEAGFVAAGLTVSIGVAINIVLNWLLSLI
jgi:hypothetical protein